MFADVGKQDQDKLKQIETQPWRDCCDEININYSELLLKKETEIRKLKEETETLQQVLERTQEKLREVKGDDLLF